MSYTIYQTEGFVLSYRDAGESDRVYVLLTKERGALVARAGGVRNLASKLRYNLVPGQEGRFSLVRGKEIWRITGAEEVTPPPSLSCASWFVRMARLVRRLVPEEEANKEMYEECRDALRILRVSQNAKERTVIETTLAIKLLATLGYATDKPEIARIHDMSYEEALPLVTQLGSRATEEVTKLLKETHL